MLVASLAIFGLGVGQKFFSAYALTLILQQVAITGIIGAAQTLVILTAGIDLSVGAIMVLTSVIVGKFHHQLRILPGRRAAGGRLPSERPAAPSTDGWSPM